MIFLVFDIWSVMFFEWPFLALESTHAAHASHTAHTTLETSETHD